MGQRVSVGRAVVGLHSWLQAQSEALQQSKVDLQTLYKACLGLIVVTA